MTSESFVIVIDTPSIKKYVFGTDSLNEMRGASANLARLNRDDMQRCLASVAKVELVYANGGSAQFLARDCDAAAVKTACAQMVRSIREQTGGEVRVVYGIAPLQDETSYREAARLAHFQLRCQREFAACQRSAPLLPIMMECQSASYLPAARMVGRGTDGAKLLSAASYEKDQQGREAHRCGLWADWMRHLKDAGPWPEPNAWDKLRCKDLAAIGSQRGYLGVVYADGNAMGQIVQELDRPETFRQFSRIVDQSIREACFTALSDVSLPEIDKIREASTPDCLLRADVLLLGGDDLLVAAPADRVLDFARQVTSEFERRTKEKIEALSDADTRQFFRDRLGDQGFTISCGVAIAKSNYPFYLSLDLAEQLLRSAKRQDGPQPETDGAARIDFHVVAGANSHALAQVRQDTYRVLTDAPRTLRPLSRSQLASLRAGVQELRRVEFPRSKLHELQEAALIREANQADWRVRDVFSRCRRPDQRRALWQAISALCPAGHEFYFPWFQTGGQRLLCVVDLAEAYDLFPK